LCAAGPGLAQNEASGSEAVFMQNSCFVCRLQHGLGGVGPAFRNDLFLTVSDQVVGEVPMGRGVMASFGDKRDDRQAAAVANGIRHSRGNRFGDVGPEPVAGTRRDPDAVRHQAASSPPDTTGSARPQPGMR